MGLRVMACLGLGVQHPFAAYVTQCHAVFSDVSWGCFLFHSFQAWFFPSPLGSGGFLERFGSLESMEMEGAPMLFEGFRREIG